jgi:hypothetical protein
MIESLSRAPGAALLASPDAAAENRRAAAAHERLTQPVPAAGTARRLQSLAFMGHSARTLADRLGLAERVVRRVQRGKPAQVPAALATAVSALYDDLWDVRGGSARSAQMAARYGWVPPLAWDDDPIDGNWIDDPDAVPADWRPRRVTLADRAEDIADVMAAGHATLQQAAWRLGITCDHLEHIVSRARRSGGAA